MNTTPLRDLHRATIVASVKSNDLMQQASEARIKARSMLDADLNRSYELDKEYRLACIAEKKARETYEAALRECFPGTSP